MAAFTHNPNFAYHFPLESFYSEIAFIYTGTNYFKLSYSIDLVSALSYVTLQSCVNTFRDNLPPQGRDRGEIKVHVIR